VCVLSVPSFGPMGVEANATSSTTIVVKWGDVPREHQNGQIEGFKVYYGSNPRLPFQVCSRFMYCGVRVCIPYYFEYKMHIFTFFSLKY
jgi:hypothetical protein